MLHDIVHFGPAALAAIDSLDPPIRRLVLAEIHDLGVGGDPESRPNVFDSDWEGASYVLRPNADPTLDVLFRCDPALKTIEVVDVIRPEALRSILRQAVSPGSSR
jgi:hypothetical protein